MLGLDAPAFGRGEPLGWDLERGEIVQGLRDAPETFLEPDAEWPEGGARGLGAYGVQRLGEQTGALARCGGAEGRDESQALLRAQTVAFGGVLECLLLLVGQGAKRVGDRRSDLTVVELLLERRRQTLRQDPTPGDPVGPMAGPSRHRALALAVLRDEGVDHAGLVHGCYAARGRVGAQEEELALERGRGLLDDDRDLATPRRDPVREALEAVHDLEGAVRLRRHPQWHLGEDGCALRRRRRARAQRGQTRAQALHVEPAHLRYAVELRDLGTHGRRW